MAAGKLQAPRGTFDVLPEDAERRVRIEQAAARILGAAGYRRIETPAFEATELFARGVGEATDIVQKEMYTFEDGGGRSLTLRPEGTAPVCRAYLEHGMHKHPQPVRLWYLSSFFRYERAQAGRYRQFWQVGAEAIGSEDPALDAEAILLLADVLAEVGCRGVELRISSLGTPATRAQYRELLKDYLREHEAQLAPEVAARIELNPLRAFDAQDADTRAVMTGAPRLLDHLTPEDAARFGAVCALLDDAGVAYELDPTLVRGLDYYTHTVFEFSSAELGAQSGVGGGGRYDGLIEQLGGPATPAIGWAAGIERMLLAAGEQPSDPPAVDLYVAHERDEDAARAFALARDARRAGLAAQNEVAGRSLKGQLKQADRLGARFVAVLGADGARLRERGAGEEQIEPERIVARLLERRHT